MTTAELLNRCVKKDTLAWEEFVRRYNGVVTRSVKHRLRTLGSKFSKNEHQDIAQDIFLSIWEKDKLALVKDAVSVKGWLAIVSLNHTSNYYRKVSSDLKDTFSLDEKINPGSSEIKLGDILPCAKHDTAVTLRARELDVLLKEELSKLVDSQRLALKLSVYDGHTQKDIAKIMNVPENTAATLISRAKNNLKKAIMEAMHHE